MFDKAVEVSEVGSAITSRNSFGCLARVRPMLKIGLLALLIQSPLYATEPIDVDPDPDSTTIVVQASEEEDTTRSLPPGRYMIIVVAEDGSTEAREIHKRSS